MKGTFKNQLLALKAEKEIISFLQSEGPQRPFVIGLKCMPKENKEGTHNQWAYKHLGHLLEKDLIRCFKNKDDITVCGLKECLQ
jgi:hypothetical protein